MKRELLRDKLWIQSLHVAFVICLEDKLVAAFKEYFTDVVRYTLFYFSCKQISCTTYIQKTRHSVSYYFGGVLNEYHSILVY